MLFKGSWIEIGDVTWGERGGEPDEEAREASTLQEWAHEGVCVCARTHVCRCPGFLCECQAVCSSVYVRVKAYQANGYITSEDKEEENFSKKVVTNI